jgi:Cu(I)/Ag(I) efflux system membrane fusion protein
MNTKLKNLLHICRVRTARQRLGLRQSSGAFGAGRAAMVELFLSGCPRAGEKRQRAAAVQNLSASRRSAANFNGWSKIVPIAVFAAILLAGILVAGCSGRPHDADSSKSGAQNASTLQLTNASKSSKTLYTCGMHPWIIQDHPGNCPICGMKLEPVRKQAGEATGSTASTTGKRKIKYWRAPMDPTYISDKPGKSPMGMDLAPVYEDEANAASASLIGVDPVTIQEMDVRTTPVVRGPLRRTIRTVGYMDYDEPALADVTIKFKGWIEKLDADYTGQLVRQGKPLFTIYSPELYSAQVEFVEALSTGDKELLQSARTKLKFFDISDAQIAELAKTGQPRKTMQILAPADGFVIQKNVVQGQMVDAGATLYRLADLGIVWGYAQIYEQDLPYIKLGQEATMTLSYLPGRTFHGRVTYIYPTVDEKTRTAKVRLEFKNPDYSLKPGMFANVKLTAEVAPSALLVPDSAVLRSGEKDTVFVALPGGKFDPRTVTLGLAAENDHDQVLSGLQEGDRVVTSGEFMLDSESQMREAIQKMTEPTPDSTATNSSAPVSNESIRNNN